MKITQLDPCTFTVVVLQMGYKTKTFTIKSSVVQASRRSMKLFHTSFPFKTKTMFHVSIKVSYSLPQKTGMIYKITGPTCK